jgi:ATP-dependent Clp protease ATP-binding subunit ClpC
VEVLKWIGIVSVLALAALGVLLVMALVAEGIERLRGGENGDLDLDALDADDVQAVAVGLDLEHDWWDMSLEALEALPEFQTAVSTLTDADTDVDGVVALSRDSDGWVASMALAALAQRGDVPGDWVTWATRNPVRPSICEDRLLLRALAAHAERPVIGAVLAKLDSLRDDVVAEFVVSRLPRETVDASTFDRVSLDDADELETFIDRFEAELGPGFREGYERWRALSTLQSVGRIWEQPFDDPPTLLAGRRRELVEIVVGAIEQTPPRSVLLLGEHGVGKSALTRAALERIAGDGIVFETTAAQINAGAMYVGELEGRVKALVEAVAGRNVVWIVPELQETLFAGQHARSPHGLLDALLPHIESGAITLVAEVTPTAAELLVAARPRVKSAFELVRVRPLDDPETIAVARHALEHDGLDVAAADEETLAEALELAQQFLPGIAQPGNLLRLVQATVAEAAEQGATSFDGRDVLTTVAASSGLPLALLDASAPLPLDEVTSFFTERVLEQPEAIDCIVERIAMVKAGVTDPTRPLGVFLFVGPTGTGKTEIAKTLAEFLFGSPERLIRLDMSEYQTPESFDRLLSDTAVDTYGATLISSVRKDPFAVILLDEFEKASQPVLDLFLQVFDDGRLTDVQGRVVDFRRSVIVLTSNIGSPLAQGGRLGFDPDERTFSSASVDRAVRRSFRPELVNRFDRIVVFRPFERSAMRALLDKELAGALARRGLRGRPWAVEVDESAYAFLIEKGFSPELGARPLKRAVERHLLAPLAAAIVEQSVPAGDQFLFVTAPSGERIEVAFVDPDAEPELEPEEAGATLELPALARAPRGDDSSVRFALAELERIASQVEAAQARKGHALSALSEPGFWDREDRFELLTEAEYLDRLQAAAHTAERLGARLRRSLRPGGGANAELVGLLAGRLYVLDRALAGIEHDAPTDLYLHLRPSGTVGDTEPRTSDAFVSVLAEMYVAWAERSGMHAEVLDVSDGEHLLAVSGLGCGEILGSEAGLHVLEHVDEGRDGSPVVDRDQVQVLVVARPAGARTSSVAVVRDARAALKQAAAPSVVVRRYRPGKSPLVRDGVRGYRTGKLDRVLAGDFDLF